MHTAKRAGFWLFIASVIFAFLPVIAVLISTSIAGFAGCDVNEGGAQACTFLGVGIGGLLAYLFVSGWYAFITFPLGGIGALIGLALYIIARVVLYRRASSGQLGV